VERDFSRLMGTNNKSNPRGVKPNKSSSTKASRNLQLWTNQSKTKYAIRFKNELQYLVTTDPKVLYYTTLIAESDRIFEGYEYDWKYILNKWIGNHKIATGFKKRSKFLFSSMTSSDDRSNTKNTRSAKTGSQSSFHATTLDGKRYSVILKPYIKCHFCKLSFETYKNRTIHGIEWHPK
jgi:hypothetical protein